MNKSKKIFYQTLMISTCIFFFMGIQEAIRHFISGKMRLDWPWYIPISIVFTGFISAIVSVYANDEDAIVKNSKPILRITIHFFTVLLVVSICGKLFYWYGDISEYGILFVIYVIVYALVTIGSIWIYKTDEKKINEAIKNFKDSE